MSDTDQGAELATIKTEHWPFKTESSCDDNCTTVLRRSLSADDSSGSDSGSQSHDEDAGTASGSSSTSASNVEPISTRLHATR